MNRLLAPKLPMPALLVALLLVCFAALSPVPASATVYTLTDGNSVAKVNDASQAGMFEWTLDGTPQLGMQWFWYRVGDVAEQSIDNLTLQSASSTTNSLTLNYTLPGSFNLQVAYLLVGGAPGSGTADIAETIRIDNISGETLEMHFFQYTDFDLEGTGAGDIAQVVNANAVKQWANVIVSETVAGPAPSRFEVNLYPNILNALNDGTATNLSNNAGPVGPGDATWAFQWDREISAGGTLIISKDKHLSVVPLPPSMVLLGSGLLGLVGLRFRRK